MSFWTWVLVGLCAGGVLLPLMSVVPVLRRAARLRRRMETLQQARLFTSLESLNLQKARLQHLNRQAEPLVERAHAAIETLAGSTSRTSAGMRDALESTGAAIRDLVSAMR